MAIMNFNGHPINVRAIGYSKEFDTSGHYSETVGQPYALWGYFFTEERYDPPEQAYFNPKISLKKVATVISAQCLLGGNEYETHRCDGHSL
jgi:hypothetical protein